jgi:hypothetical protein
MTTPQFAKNGVSIECPSSSKARNLRRMFYHWQARLVEMDRNFMEKFEYKLNGREVKVQPKFDWTPKEVANVSTNQGKVT